MKEFAAALRVVIQYVRPGAALHVAAEALRISPSQLSHWLHGRRLPDREAVRLMSELAQRGAHRMGAVLELEPAELLALLCAARRSKGHPSVDCTCLEGDRRNGAAFRMGDRRNSPSASPVGADRLAAPPDLLGLLAEMKADQRIALLADLAASWEESEIAHAAEKLAHAGMGAEMEALIRYARRAGKDSTEVAVALAMRRVQLG
ncbi:hypothetical protein [Streptomyces sparsus]